MLGQPSVIARLMGMETPEIVPATATPAIPAALTIQAAEEDNMVKLLKPPSKSKLKQFKCSPLAHHGRISGEYYRYCLSKMKPRRRSSRRSSSSSSSSRGGHRRDHDRHPQEELLEKIKEEFRASWQQASMTPENAAVMTSASASGRSCSGEPLAGWVDGRYIQRVAQENLRREKMARIGHGATGKSTVEEDDADIETVVEVTQQHQGGSDVADAMVANGTTTVEEDVEAAVKEAEPAEQQRDAEVAVCEDSEEFFRGIDAGNGGDHASDTSENSRGTPTRIAILRPIGTTRGPGAADDRGERALGTPPPSWKAAGDGGSGMEEFLRAVKERLDKEMKAKTGAGDVVATTTTARRLWGSADPEQQTAQDTARRIREAAGNNMAKEDLGRRLSRLESFRVFRGDRGRREASAVLSPEHKMLKRVRARIEAMSPKKTRLSGGSSPVSSRGARVWSSQSPPVDASLSGIGSDDEESGRGGDRQRLMTKLWKVHDVAVSPRALVRSFSAPASSGISGGAEAKLSRSRSFSLLRGTVASGISLGGKLLTTMMHLSKKKPLTTTMDCPSPPQDSGTAAQADFLAGLAPPSPVSPLEVHGRSPRHFSGCTFLPESSPRRSPRCSSELEASVVGGESPWRWKTDAAGDNDDDPDKLYVRELLMAAGLFDDDDQDDGGAGGSWEDMSVGSTDSMSEPTFISDNVFDEVEDAYYYRRLRRRVEEDGGAGEEEEDGWHDRRRLLFDLANEALLVMQAVPSSSSPSLRRWVIEGGNGVSQSRLRSLGRDLEDDVWWRVARAMTGDDDAPATTTVDGMVEREVRMSPWMALRGDVCAVGRTVERAIFDELVSEVVHQVFVRT